MSRQRSSSNILWDYFERCENKLGECNMCHKQLSYKTSITNLKQHLKYKHKHAYKEMQSRGANFGSSGAKRSASPDQKDETDGPSVKFSSEILRRFDIQDDSARCNICDEAVSSTIEDMKMHLEEQHSQLLDDIIAKAQKSMDSDTEAEDNVYTEVVYLEDEPKPRKKARKERPSLYYDYTPKQENIAKQDDLEVFLNYLRSLLKKVPKEATSKLQLDIINLIISAQEGIQNGSRMIAVPIQNLVQDKVIMPNLYVNTTGITTSSSDTVVTTMDSQ